MTASPGCSMKVLAASTLGLFVVLCFAAPTAAYNGDAHFAITMEATRLLSLDYPAAYRTLLQDLTDGNACPELRDMSFTYFKKCDVMNMKRIGAEPCLGFSSSFYLDDDLDGFVLKYTTDFAKRLAIQAVAPDFYSDLALHWVNDCRSGVSAGVDFGPFGGDTIFIPFAPYNHFLDIAHHEGRFDSYDGYSYAFGSGVALSYTSIACDKGLSDAKAWGATWIGVNPDQSADRNAANLFDHIDGTDDSAYVAIDCSGSVSRYSFPSDTMVYGSVAAELAERFPDHYSWAVFMPVDNMARYWFGRFESTEDPLCLGPALHAVQDCSIPQHAAGVLGCGHAAYETDVDDAVAGWLADPSFVSRVRQLVREWDRIDPNAPFSGDRGARQVSAGMTPAINWPVDQLATWLALHAYWDYFRVIENAVSAQTNDTWVQFHCATWLTFHANLAKELVAKATAMSVLVLLKSVGTGCCRLPNGACENAYCASCEQSGGTFGGEGTACALSGRDISTALGGSSYTIISRNSFLCLDVEGAATTDGANVQQFALNGGDNQLWRFEHVVGRPANYYRIVNVKSGKCMDVDTSSHEMGKGSGANVRQWTKRDVVGFQNQIWRVVPTARVGYYSIISVWSDNVLDVEGASKVNNANVQQWAANGGQDNQLWALVPFINLDNGGYYALTAKHSGKALDVELPAVSNGASVQQWSANQEPNQLWILQHAIGRPLSCYYIVNMRSGLRLEVDTGPADKGMADGAHVQQWTSTGGENQLWLVLPATQFSLAEDGTRVQDVSQGYYRIVNVLSGESLDVQGALPVDGANVQQYTWNSGDNQLWRLTRLR